MARSFEWRGQRRMCKVVGKVAPRSAPNPNVWWVSLRSDHVEALQVIAGRLGVNVSRLVEATLLEALDGKRACDIRTVDAWVAARINSGRSNLLAVDSKNIPQWMTFATDTSSTFDRAGQS